MFASPGTIAEYTRVAAEGSFDHDRSMYIGTELAHAGNRVAQSETGWIWLLSCIQVIHSDPVAGASQLSLH